MDYKDREKIDFMCNELLQDININKLWPKLLENRVYYRDDVNIPNWLENMTHAETVRDICSVIKTRGPHAFKNLIKSLKESGHHTIADQLENYGSISSNNSNYQNAHTSTEQLSNTNVNSSTFEETPDSDEEPSNNSSEFNNETEEYSHDSYYTRLDKYFEPLTIKVKKADKFRDGPDFKHIERYVMRSSPRGYVLIITNISYKLLDSRPSAKYDEDNLKELFEQMGFETIIHSNLTGSEIKKKVKEFSQMRELRRVDSAFVIISSHGTGEDGKQETEIQGVDYNLPDYESVVCTDIIDYFTAEQCPNLRGKPKIFIFQTCSNKQNKTFAVRSKVNQTNFKSNNLSTLSSNSARGEKIQKAVSRTVTDSMATESSSDLETRLELSTRNYEDTLIAYATIPGYVSFRDTYNGSWFIQILCEVFMNYACEKHIQDLFTMTDRRLKDLRTLRNECQTLWWIHQGFHKHCYLNPGLFHKPNNDVK